MLKRSVKFYTPYGVPMTAKPQHWLLGQGIMKKKNFREIKTKRINSQFSKKQFKIHCPTVSNMSVAQ